MFLIDLIVLKVLLLDLIGVAPFTLHFFQSKVFTSQSMYEIMHGDSRFYE